MNKQSIILAVEASTSFWSVSMLYGQQQIGFCAGDKETGLSKYLIPKISEILTQTGKRISDIDLFAVSNGPGSFTGLRVANSVIQGVAKAAGKKIIGFTYLEVLANALNFNKEVCIFSIITGGKVCWQNFEKDNGKIKYSSELKIESLEAFFQRSSQNDLYTDPETFRKLEANLIEKSGIRSIYENNLAFSLGQLASLQNENEIWAIPFPIYQLI